MKLLQKFDTTFFWDTVYIAAHKKNTSCTDFT